MNARAAPGFWWRKTGAPALVLAPFGALYGAVTAHRMARTGARIGVPVLCIGNFVVGGAGKTPTALAVAGRLAARGLTPAFVSRGYGRRRGRDTSEAVTRVDPSRDRADEVGDEPLLLARAAPCFVSNDRVAAARAAVAAGASVVVLDDGFQNPSLGKDASLVVVDGAAGVGNGLCLPAGPLRAPLSRQWPSTTLLAVIGAGPAGEVLAAEATRRGIGVLRGGLEPDPNAVAALMNRRLLGFSGIGRPEKFFETLTGCGLDLAGRLGFPDHHTFTEHDRTALLRAAAETGSCLVTTEKDIVRLPEGFPAAVLPVTLRFADDAPLEGLLDQLVRASPDPRTGSARPAD